MRFEPRLLATAIGSLPHRSAIDACRLMLDTLGEMPAWPQLPERSFLENMYVQFAEGLPGIKVDSSGERVWFQVDGNLDAELEDFYQSVIEEDLERFRISASHAEGLDLFCGGGLSEELAGRHFLKGQVTGPISFGLTVTDQKKKASLYYETLEQAIVKGLTLKARWQTRLLKEAAPEAEIVLFVDEPYLVSVGSALISVNTEQVVGDMTECVTGCGADITGMHCCGNTDWSMVFATGVDIVNFDAFDFLEGFIAYDREISRHLDNGGSVAWGVVPNDDRVLDVSAEELVKMVEGAFLALEKKGIDPEEMAIHSLITPACGMGRESMEVAERSLMLTKEVSSMLRRRYF